MKKIFTLVALLSSVNALFSQQSWTDEGPNFATNSFNPIIKMYGDTTFVAYGGASNTVVFKKLVGNTWETLVTQSTFGGKFDLEKDNDGSILLAFPTADFDGAGSYNLNVKFYRYANGALNNDPTVTVVNQGFLNNIVDIFDLAINPNGGMGFVYRFNNSFEAQYFSYINGSWSNLFFHLGGTGIKDAQLHYNNNGAIILARNASALNNPLDAMCIFAYIHNTASPIPDSALPTHISSIQVHDAFSITHNNDTFYFTYKRQDNSETKLNALTLNASTSSIAFTETFDFGDAVTNVKVNYQGNNELFVGYLDVLGATEPGNIALYTVDNTNNTIINPQILGNVNFNNAGNIVGQYSFDFNNSNLYVAYNYGPPFINSKVRRFGCAPAPVYTADAVTHEIATTATIPASATFQWYDCNTNTPINGATSSTYTPTVTGSYVVEITDGVCVNFGNCVQVTLAQQPDPTSVTELSKPTLTVFPNPASRNFTIKNIMPGSTIKIVNALGQQVFSEKTTQETINLTAQNFQNGIYFIIIEHKNNTVETQKLIINK